MTIRDDVELTIRHQPYLCRHHDDYGRVKGEHESRLWEVVTQDNTCLLRASECYLKWCQLLRPASYYRIPDPIGDAVRAHPDWDPAPPPVFSELLPPPPGPQQRNREAALMEPGDDAAVP